MNHCCYEISQIISAFVAFLLVTSYFSYVQSVNVNYYTNRSESEKLEHIRDYLKKINKPAVKTIQSPDGDIIDCVLTHQQPAFDHPLLKGQKPMDPPEIPKWPTSHNETMEENIQVWTMSGESCPENTVPIRRTTEQDVLRAGSVPTFGRKTRHVRKEYGGKMHEHAIGYVKGSYYGAAAVMDVWGPHVETPREFSLSQIWVRAGTFEQGDLNTVEAGWQVFPSFYKDTAPRLFVYWTSDAYQTTGCYNFECDGFVQKSSKIIPGGAIRPVSTYNKKLFDLPFLIHKDIKKGDWWLYVNRAPVGYWPANLFTYLKNGPADIIQFGGEISNTKSSGAHTKTEMGSGHFPGEGYGKAACFKQLQVYDGNDNLVPVPQNTLLGFFENKNCYWAGAGSPTQVLGTYFFYGGSGGNNPMCN